MVKIKETEAWNLTAECVSKAIGSTQGHGEGKLCVLALSAVRTLK